METSTSTVCSIQTHGSDELRLIDLPPELLTALRTAIAGVESIQSEGVHPNNKRCWKIKLRGRPWGQTHQSRAAGVVKSARLILNLLGFMNSHDWGLELAMHPQSQANHDCWFFTKLDESGYPGRLLDMCCIAFSFNDKIRVIDGRPEVSEAVRSTISTYWDQGLQGETVNHEAKEFQLRGNPWSCSTGTTITALFLAKLIERLKIAGWNVYVSTAHRFIAPESGSSPAANKWILSRVRA